MDGASKKRRKAKRNIPNHPINTYKWEDLRRSRKRGAYPWTHLTKPPFDEEADPEEYTMDAFRRSRSTSTIGKSDTQEISECEELEMEEHDIIPEDKENINPSNVDEPSTSEIKPKLTPVPNNGNRAKSEEPKKKRKLSIESSYSRISLSKLNLRDKLKNVKTKLKVPQLPKRSKSDASEAKDPKKQKKLAGRLERGVWMPPPSDKSPVYIHIPLKPPPGEEDEFSKLEFESPGPSSHSGSATNLARIGSGNRKMSLLGILTEIKKVHDLQHKQKLAGESKDDLTKKEVEKKLGRQPKFGDKIKMEVDDDETKPNVELVESTDSTTSQPKRLDIAKASVQRKESDRLVIEEITDDDRRSNKSNKSTEEGKPGSNLARKPRTPEPIVDEPEDSSADDNISQYLDKDDKCEIVSEKSVTVSSENVSQAGPSKIHENKLEPTPETSKSDVEKLLKLEATLSKWKKQTPTPAAVAAFNAPFSARIKVPKEDSERQRAKSEEPKRKRRSSIESSYSRKSLSKLAFMKRLREATDKIKLPKFPSFAKSDKKDSKLKKTEEKPVEKPKTSKLDHKKPQKPVYIHIPLKLPPGETDEFSHLAEYVPIKISEPKVEQEKQEEAESSVPTSPDVPSDVQIIILTAPSDDEILSASIPETPSESDQKFFEGTKIDELKNLAKKAVDVVYVDKKLETVTEDEGSDEQSAPESSQEQVEGKIQEDSQKQQQMLVDEEDGLKLSDAAIAMINEEMAKEMKEQEQSLKPALKKKVSFKRRSRAEDGERIYEDVQLSKDSQDKKDTPANLSPLESFQSMSVDEEKSYLDKKIIKDTSLEDDYKKWSTENDHEYEPVNPPPEEMTISGSPAVHDIHQQAQAPGQRIDSKTSSLERRSVRIPLDEELVVRDEADMPGLEENLSAQEVQSRIEDRFFAATPETISSRTDGELNTSQVDSSALETLPLKKENRKKTTTKKEETPSKSFNETLRTQAGKLKSRLQSIKKPTITLPQRPKFTTTKIKKPNFKKPSFTMPKMPERPSINLPSFSLTRKDRSKDSWRERQHSTESNAGDSTKKLFDFRTYPRIFDKYKKNKEKESSPSKDDRDPTPPPPEFATVPRTNRKKGPVGSRWVNKFKDIKYADEDARKSKEIDDQDTQDVIKIPLRPDNEDPMDMPSHTRYNEDIDIDDEFDRENRDIHRASPFSRDYLKRWNHGEFHEDPQLSHQLPYRQEFDRGGYRVTDLDNDMEETQITPPEGSFEMKLPPRPKEEHSSGSLSEHRRGVLEEIDSDEFFLREKGISQDNIEVGKYLSSEIREAFRNPVNALAQLQSEDREYDLDLSDQSEPLQDVPKRKPLRKPKRKKTPHVSNEQISFDRESITTEPEEYPKQFDDYKTFVPPAPARPKRRSKKSKKKKPLGDVIPYQETIPIEEQLRSFTPIDDQRFEPSNILPDNILGDNQQMLYENGVPQMYENEHMMGIEQPEIKVSDPYYRYENFQRDIDKYLEENIIDEAPTAPTRKHRSLKSLNASEPDSIVEELKVAKEIPRQNVEAYRAEQEYIIPTPEPPSRPKRTRSRTHSQSGSQQEDDRTSHGADSLISDTQAEVPCVEVPCIQDIRDAMGYAIVDKSKGREPPLPPSRIPSTPPRTRRSKRSTSRTDPKFSTVPRSLNEGPPIRPLRNYSTLGGSNRTSRSKSPTSLRGEEKENIDMGQYIEIENGVPVRRLQSGAIIQKMRDRPLPPPPRPPRRPRGSQREVFRDISHERNIPTEPEIDFDKTNLDETEMSTQTEPLPDDFVIERMQPDDLILTDIERQILPFDHEETVTHAALVVQPINNAQILPHSQIHHDSRPSDQPPMERVIPVSREYTPPRRDQHTYDDEETSEIPEEFMKLKNPPKPPVSEEKVQQSKEKVYHEDSHEVGLLKAQKMQVLDLDVEKLRVNELQANKIIVSELDGISLQVSEINSKSGNLVLSGIELPPHLIQEMLDKLQSAVHEQPSSIADQSTSPQSSETRTMKPEPPIEEEEDPEIGQKKTSIEDLQLEEAPPVPPRYDSKTDLLEEIPEDTKEFTPEPSTEFDTLATQECQDEEEELINLLAQEEIADRLEPPVRPPRRSSQPEKVIIQDVDEETNEKNTESLETIELESTDQNLEEVNAEPPPAYSEIPQESSDSLPPLDSVSKSEEEPPPRPPQPIMQPDAEYVPSQPPASFYELRSHPYGEFTEEDIPLPPRRKRHHKAPPVSRSSSDDVPPAPRRHHRSPEPSIPQLTGQLVRACATETDRSITRLISHITNNVFQNADGKQDLHVMILLLLILIAGLILLSGDVTIHHHHWEFFNPPRDL